MSFLNEDIFVRAPWRFVLSQRFKHICTVFHGTFRLATEALLTNFLLRVLPRSLSSVVLFIFILFSFLLFANLIDFARKDEDPDLFDVMKITGRAIKEAGIICVFVCFVMVGLLVNNRAENLNPDIVTLYAIFIFLFFLIVIIQSFK